MVRQRARRAGNNKSGINKSKAPKGIKGGRRFATAEDFSEFLITEKLISTVPWDDAGSFIRFSATFIAKGEAEEKRVISEVKKRLSGLNLEF